MRNTLTYLITKYNSVSLWAAVKFGVGCTVIPLSVVDDILGPE